MPKRSSKQKSPDINEIAHRVVAEATGGNAVPQPTKKNPAAVALGRLGGAKGGRSRADSLTAERRKEIAAKAAEARWKRAK
jgi:hypothetical protein